LKLRLHARLVVAFVLVAVPPLLLLAVAVNTLLTRRFQTEAQVRLDEAVAKVVEQVNQRRGSVIERVALIAQRELAAVEMGDDGGLYAATRLARTHDLPLLEILDSQGRVLSSHHWLAGVGLPDRDRSFEGDEALRVETVASGFGAAEALALAPAHAAQWQGVPVVVRAGFVLDEGFVGSLSSLMGVQVALHDQVRGVWIARSGSALAQWPAPYTWEDGHGEVSLAGAPHRWSAAKLHPHVWAVVATPRASLDATLRDVRRLGLALAAAALVAALAASFAFAARIARPVSDLADGARRVAGGDLETAVPAQGEDEVAELAIAFNRMTAELRDSRDRLLQAERVAAWREMARRLAHELKNPLFPIQLSIETLRRALDHEGEGDGSGPFRALFRDSSETILQELAALRRIIEEFSQFARMPQPELRPTDVNEVVGRVLDLYQPRAAGVSLESDLAADLPAVPADADLLGRALGNLVGNAFDAMGAGGVLRVRTARDPDAVRIEVEDTGPGLTDDQRTRLFTPYYTTKRGGTGLGLAIVQGIVSDHGGRIQVRSAPGEGTTFTLLLPLESTS
jgi:two-component system, NtrC family, nitrogen regulation sensor histidine kinase NtrY